MVAFHGMLFVLFVRLKYRTGILTPEDSAQQYDGDVFPVKCMITKLGRFTYGRAHIFCNVPCLGHFWPCRTGQNKCPAQRKNLKLCG